MKRSLAVWLFGLAFAQAAFCAPTINDLEVTPIEPLGLAIDYTVSGAADIDIWRRLVVTMTLNGKTTYMARSFKGATNCVNGVHRVYWNMAADGISVYADDATVEVTYRYPKYYVIDLQGGATSETYPVAYLDTPPQDGFNTIEYKTTKMVLQLLDSGSFKSWCGSRDKSPPKNMDYQNDFRVTNPFYLGIYEVTQKQWELVMGTNLCEATTYGKGDAYPVHYVSYDMIRGRENGKRWPATNTVDEASFLGKLRTRTKIDFDLPTERQWEYACRAGTTTIYSWGDNFNGDYMWADTSSAHEVGTKLANAWGFYDMHGNVSEWCLDWYNVDVSAYEDNDKSCFWGLASNERGASGWKYRVHRGGSWDDQGTDNNTENGEHRGHDTSRTVNSTLGFRLALPFP